MSLPRRHRLSATAARSLAVLLSLMPVAAHAAEDEILLKCTINSGKSYPLLRENPIIYEIHPDKWYYWSSKNNGWVSQCTRLGNITKGIHGAESYCELTTTKLAVYAFIKGTQSSSIEIDRTTGAIETSDVFVEGSTSWDNSSYGTCEKTQRPVAPPPQPEPQVKF